MFSTLLLLGLVCVIAAVVGGGLKVADIELPLVSAVRRQVFLGVVGVGIVGLAFLLRDRPRATSAERGLPSGCVAEIRKTAEGPRGREHPELRSPIAVDPGPAALTAERGYVWVAHTDGRVTRIPARTDKARIRSLRGVRVGTENTGQVSIASGFGSAYVTKRVADPPEGVIARIDRSGERTERELDAPDNVAVGAGAVWVTHDNGQLSRLDPSTLDGSQQAIGGDPHGLWAEDPPCVYVATNDPDGYSGFDATTGKRIRAYSVGGAGEIVAGAGALWLTDTTNSRLLRVDPAEPSRADAIPVSISIGNDALAADTRGVWTADGKRTVVRIDPSGRFPRTEFSVEGGPVAIAIGPDHVWVAQQKGNQITGIQP